MSQHDWGQSKILRVSENLFPLLCKKHFLGQIRNKLIAAYIRTDTHKPDNHCWDMRFWVWCPMGFFSLVVFFICSVFFYDCNLAACLWISAVTQSQLMIPEFLLLFCFLLFLDIRLLAHSHFLIQRWGWEWRTEGIADLLHVNVLSFLRNSALRRNVLFCCCCL